ncbi:MAG: hypothetical protein WEE89_06505 [Gemmatimonadota bacterium]
MLNQSVYEVCKLPFLALLLGAAAVVPRTVQAQADGAVAIVVHPDTKIDNLSFDELQRIFRGERQFWPDKSRITLLVRAPVSVERKLVLQKIYKMSEEQFRQYWIGKMFRAEVAAGPKIVYSSDMARDLVTAIPGAIAFMPADMLSTGVKVLRIDGALPGDRNYPLR